MEMTLESLLDCKEIKPVNPKGNQAWTFIGRTDAEAEVPILQPPDEKNWLTGKDRDAGKGWRQGRRGISGEGDNPGWDDWMASPTWWTGVWASFGSWWWTGKPGVLQSMGSQRVGQNGVTELNWTEKMRNYYAICFPILWILFIDSFSPVIQIWDEIYKISGHCVSLLRLL